MPAQLLSGRAVASRLKAELPKAVADLHARQIRPHLVSVQVGDDIVSDIYVRNQQRACRSVGIRFTRLHLDACTTQDELIEHIRSLNINRSITGIILQMPLPAEIDARAVQAEILPEKDVEGVSPENLGKLMLKNYRLPPCTPVGIMELLLETGVELRGANVCLVGHSEIVGKPTALLLLDRLATVTVCHHGTPDVAVHSRHADILITATGKPGLIKADMIKPGAVVIDVGFSTVPDLRSDGTPLVDEHGKPRSKVVGDVDFEAAKDVAGWLTPVPGGVGPVTTATLMRNTVVAAGGPVLPLGI